MKSHCRICGYVPPAPKPGEPDLRIEIIVEHLEGKHPSLVLGSRTELWIAYQQRHGDDSRCDFHSMRGAQASEVPQ